jgi:hypothetical protein
VRAVVDGDWARAPARAPDAWPADGDGRKELVRIVAALGRCGQPLRRFPLPLWQPPPSLVVGRDNLGRLKFRLVDPFALFCLPAGELNVVLVVAICVPMGVDGMHVEIATTVDPLAHGRSA